MCGIFGILNLKGELDTRSYNIPADTQILKHRGPDDKGYFLDSSIYLAHRRLSIIDLCGGKQPIFNEDKTKCIIFNGEIYNFNELKNELQKKGHKFITESDTEVIIHSYEEWGRDCVHKLRGMFCFAIWEAREKRLLLVRDRLGIKPLFYAVYKDILYFASEMKAILEYSFFPREIDSYGLAAYFTLSYIPAPLTVFKNIHKLLPGHTLEVCNGDIYIKKYWDLKFCPDRSKTEKYFIENYMRLLDESVKLRMISDVPVGAFLSGGIDSGLVVALMNKHTNKSVHTFSMGFGGDIGGYLDERYFAGLVAQQYDTVHKIYEVHPNISKIIKDIVGSFDEPFADDSTIPSYYLYKITSENVKVALSGLGGDELFGGYERYLGFKLSMYYNFLPHSLRESVIRRIIEKIPERADGHYTVNHLKRFVRSASLPSGLRYFGFVSLVGDKDGLNLFTDPISLRNGVQNCRELMMSYFNSANAEEPLDRVFYCDLKTYLPEDILACTDRLSMFHSLEARVPFLDHKLVEFCATIPSEYKINLFTKKAILKKGVKKILPKEVLSHRKQGFVGPLSRWLQSDLRSYVLDVLSEPNLKKHGMFNQRSVSKMIEQHINRVENHDKRIWSLVMFQSWYDEYIK